jgi:uncharacterized Rmd1/YagE family protein
MKTCAYQIADSLNIREIRKHYDENLIFFDSDELYYEIDHEKYVYVFEYGVLSFFGTDTDETQKIINYMSAFCENKLDEPIQEDFIIELNNSAISVYYNKIVINEINPDLLRIIMHSVSQSLALDYLSNQAETLLNNTKVFTEQLETAGKLKIKGKKLKRFIGKSLNLKNKISHNLYIFDSHPEIRENEEHDRIDKQMKKAFDLYDRSGNLTEDIDIIRENLDLFIELMHHRKSSFLEWIIILLILVEVLNMAFEKLLN